MLPPFVKHFNLTPTLDVVHEIRKIKSSIALFSPTFWKTRDRSEPGMNPGNEGALTNADLEFPWIQVRRKDVAIPLNGKFIATQTYCFVTVTIRTLQYGCKKKRKQRQYKAKNKAKHKCIKK